MTRTKTIAVALIAALLAFGCSDDDGGNDNQDGGVVRPDAYVGDCQQDPTPVFGGDYQSIVNTLIIASGTVGFDLDYDGNIDNCLAPLGALANSELGTSFDEGDIVIPFEFFGLDDGTTDDCLNYAVYFATWPPDQDLDGELTDALVRDGEQDCNDYDAAINSSATEIPGDLQDNNCNGLADETWDASGEPVVSTNTTDNDGDGYSPADGDCDDRSPGDWADAPDWWDPAAINPGADEICGDGLDNNCSGTADEECDLYAEDEYDERIQLDENSLVSDNSESRIVFRSARIENGHLFSGPGEFSFAIEAGSQPVDLRITGAMFEADIVLDAHGVTLQNGVLGGVLNGYNLDQAPNIASDIFGEEDNTMLDALIGPGGILLGLPSIGVCRERGGNEAPLDPVLLCDRQEDCGDTENYRCDIEVRAPDIDVDGDGVEIFLDMNLDDDDSVFRVDTCIDGDGTIFHDDVDADGTVLMHCTEELNSDGTLRFVDGYSIAVQLTATPTTLFGITPRE